MADAREQGYQAAVEGLDRKSPYDGRSSEGKAWLEGYDSYAPPAQPDPEPEPKSDPPTDQSDSEAEDDGSGLVPAGESSDPDVHYLIANRRGHELALEDPTVNDENKRHARQAIRDIDKQLRSMGYR